VAVPLVNPFARVSVVLRRKPDELGRRESRKTTQAANTPTTARDATHHVNVALVIGEPGTGKTTFANRLVEQGRHPRRRFFVCAPWGGFRGVNVGTAAELARRPTWPPVSILRGEPEHALDLAVRVGSTTVVVDEIERLAPATVTRALPGSALARVLHEGRHYRVFLLGTTQFPLSVSASLRDVAYWLFFFRVSDPYQLQYISRRCGSQFAARVAAHTGYVPLVWTPSGVAT